jgi:hypothetical protein
MQRFALMLDLEDLQFLELKVTRKQVVTTRSCSFEKSNA